VPSVRDLVAEAAAVLAAAGFGRADAALDAEGLARHALGWDRASLLTRGREPAPQPFLDRYRALIERRARREPVAFITGHREFWSLDFEVTGDVLIPRPETELIVERALPLLDLQRKSRIADVGTGSGCLAIALAVERPVTRVLATDSSRAALMVARRNADRHGVGSRVRFVRADGLDAISGPLDLIVSNPPYVAAADAASLPPDVVQYEPGEALFAGDDGLSVLRTLIGSAAVRLAPHGHLVVEFGVGQSADVQALARTAGWASIDIAEDLQGIPRVAVLGR
jgi:release factor glutamine methyltransferase